MTSKHEYLANMDKIRAMIEAMPDDVTICSISRYYTNGKSKMTIQILQHPDIQGEKREVYDDGAAWYVVPGEIQIGYIVHEEMEADHDPDT